MIPYKIDKPILSSGGKYTFTTKYGIEYEVVFARHKSDIFHYSVAFGVTNDEFNGEEYRLTNKADVFKVIATILEVIRLFLREHPNISNFDFTGISEEATLNTIGRRTKIYLRYIHLLFPPTEWSYTVSENTVCIKRNQP